MGYRVGRCVRFRIPRQRACTANSNKHCGISPNVHVVQGKKTYKKFHRRSVAAESFCLKTSGSEISPKLLVLPRLYFAMGSLLTPTQLERLKDHKYRSQGSSLTEVFMQPYWRWLVTKIPLWVAPNLITFIGLVINVATTLPVVLGDPNMEGLVG